MAREYRGCGGEGGFNSGMSKCPVSLGKIKGIILVEAGQTLPANLSATTLEVAEHADRPYRIYPFKTVEEYAPSGGEAQTSQQGYGASKVTGLSALTESYTLANPDMQMRAKLLEAKGIPFDMYLINEDDMIIGQGNYGGIPNGIKLSGVYPSGQQFDSSGQLAQLLINVMYEDVEKTWKNMNVVPAGFPILDSMMGLTEVLMEKQTASNQYKLVEKYGSLDVTGYYGEAIQTKAATVLPGATGVTYSNGVITATGTVKLASPSVLQAAGIIGIEQVG